MSHPRNNYSNDDLSPHSNDSRSTDANYKPHWTNSHFTDGPHGMSNNSDFDGPAYFTEVKTVLRPQEDYAVPMGMSEENPFASPEIEGINAAFIDLAALRKFAPLFVTLPDARSSLAEAPVAAISTSKSLKSTSVHHYKYTFYSEKTGLIRANNLLDMGEGKLPEFLCQNVFWLDILDPSIDEIRALAEIFRLHQLTLEDMELDADDPEVREKCDVFENYFYVNLKAVDTEESSGLGPLVHINMAILAFPGMVITTHKEPLHFYRTVAKRIRLLTARSRLTADWIVYALLEDVIDFFSISGRDVEIEVDIIDELVMLLTVNDQEDMLHRIGAIRKRVVQQLRFVSNKTEVLRIIVKRASHRFSEDAGFYLRDLHEHVAMLDQNLDQYDESLNRSHNNYLARVSIEISHTSNKLNDVMKKLSVAASVALPWSLISSIWGMNITIPGHYKYNSTYYPFFTLVTIMVSSSLITYIIGRHRRWF